jgi:hypothetical protein
VAGAGWPLENLRPSHGVKFDLVLNQYGDQTRIFPIRNNCCIGVACGMIVWWNLEHEDGFGDGDEEWVAIS